MGGVQDQKAQTIRTMYNQGAYIWQIALNLDITEYEVICALGLN